MNRIKRTDESFEQERIRKGTTELLVLPGTLSDALNAALPDSGGQQPRA